MKNLNYSNTYEIIPDIFYKQTLQIATKIHNRTIWVLPQQFVLLYHKIVIYMYTSHNSSHVTSSKRGLHMFNSASNMSAQYFQ